MKVELKWIDRRTDWGDSRAYRILSAELHCEKSSPLLRWGPPPTPNCAECENYDGKDGDETGEEDTTGGRE